MKTNDPCPRCGTGTMRRYKTLTERNRRSKYFKCDSCGRTATARFIAVDDANGGKKFLPAAEVYRRRLGDK